ADPIEISQGAWISCKRVVDATQINANIQNSVVNQDDNVSNVNAADNFLLVDAGCFAGANTGWGLVCYDRASYSQCLFG
ncbi:hypothetical protein L195_g035618, partial [Trifolium pratense]